MFVDPILSKGELVLLIVTKQTRPLHKQKSGMSVKDMRWLVFYLKMVTINIGNVANKLPKYKLSYLFRHFNALNFTRWYERYIDNKVSFFFFDCSSNLR